MLCPFVQEIQELQRYLAQPSEVVWMAVELQLEGTVTGQGLDFWPGLAASCFLQATKSRGTLESASLDRNDGPSESIPANLGFCPPHW